MAIAFSGRSYLVMEQIMGEVIFLAIIAGLAGLYYYQATGYRMPKLDNSGGPAVFPKFVCIALICLILIRIIIIISKKEKKHFSFFELFKGSTGILFIGFIVYVLAIKVLGFVIASFLFLTIVGSGLRYAKLNSFGNAKTIVLQEILFIAFPILLYYFFTRVLYIALPAGLLEGIL